MKGTKILAAVAALLLITLLGCGGAAIGDLKTITINASSTNVVGEGGTIQLQAIGVYSTGDAKDLTNRVTYTITSQAAPYNKDVNGNTLATPPQTVLLNPTGMITAVAPFVCTWMDTNAGGSTAAWAITGSYQVTATFGKVTSQPLFVTVASAIGNGPSGACGPS